MPPISRHIVWVRSEISTSLMSVTSGPKICSGSSHDDSGSSKSFLTSCEQHRGHPANPSGWLFDQKCLHLLHSYSIQAMFTSRYKYHHTDWVRNPRKSHGPHIEHHNNRPAHHPPAAGSQPPADLVRRQPPAGIVGT